MSARVYQDSYCAVRCLQGKRVSLREFDKSTQNFACMDCSCKRPECEYYGICCPDYEEDYVPLPEFINNTTYIGDIYETLYNVTYKNQRKDYTLNPLPYNYSIDSVGVPVLGCQEGGEFLYIKSCFKDFTGDKNIVELCERSIDIITVDYFALAVDMATNVVYRNIYCAECNRAVMPKQLGVHIDCFNYMPFYQITDRDKMLVEVMSHSPGCCTVEKEFPHSIYLFSCYEKYFREATNSCNSARWVYDESVATACDQLNRTTDIVIDVISGAAFKNIFCAVCHKNSYPQMIQLNRQCIAVSPRLQLPFSLLINFGKSSSVITNTEIKETCLHYKNCTDEEWSSPDKSCIPLVCTPGKILKNRSCSSAFSTIVGLQYDLNFLLVGHISEIRLWSEDGREEFIEDVNNVMKMIQETLATYGVSESIKTFYIADNRDKDWTLSSSENTRILILVESNITALRGGPYRDEYEKRIFKNFIENSNNFELNDEKSFNFKTLVLTRFKKVFSYLKTKNISERELLGKKNNGDSSEHNLKKCIVDVTNPIPFTGILFCSYISFRPSHYNITIDFTTLPPEITVTIDLNVTKVKISTISELNKIEVDEDGNLNVCHEVLDSKLEGIRETICKSNIQYTLSDINLAQYIVTMTSLGCSMICLILTIFIYLWLPVLQNTAGKNNIFLCLSLLLAQTSLIVTAHRPNGDVLCICIGIMNHFLWLWMFSWTFICSFHMFNVFTASTRSQPGTREERKQLIKRIVFSVIGPTVIVASVIVVSVISSDGRHIGYGRDNCYLNSVVLVGLSVVFPLSLTIVFNVTFFVITVFSINKIRRLQESLVMRTDKQQELFVYVKLSSMTGVFWTTTIIAEVADVIPLKFIAIVLNGFQGVFIFLSYICNKRVLKVLTMKHSQTDSSGMTPES